MGDSRYRISTITPLRVRQHTIAVVIFLLMAAAPFIWLHGGLQLSRWDINYGFYNPNMGTGTDSIAYAWDYSLASGRSMNYYHPNFLLISLFYDALNALPGSAALKQAVLLSISIFVCLFFTYLLYNVLFNGEKTARMTGGIFAALFYLLNFGVMFNFFYYLSSLIYLAPAIPVLLYATVVSARRGTWWSAILLSLVYTICSFVFHNAGFGLVIAILTVIFYFLSVGIRRITFAFQVVVLTLVFNSFWLLSLLSGFNEQLGIASTLAPTAELFSMATRITDLIHTMWLLPKEASWVWNIAAGGWQRLYLHNPFFLLMPGIALIVIFSTFLRRTTSRRDKRILYSLASVSLVGIALCNAGNPPVGKIVSAVFVDHPIPIIARALAATFQKMSPFIFVPFALLFGYGVNGIYEYLKSHSRVLAVGVLGVIGIVGAVYSAPFWTGAILTSPVTFKGADVSSLVRIPPSYYEVKKLLAGDKETYRIASLPLATYNMYTYTWEHGYLGEPFEKNLFHRGVYSLMHWKDSGLSLLIKALEKKKHLVTIASLLNIKYFLVHHDLDLVNGNYAGPLMSPEAIEEMLSKEGCHSVGTSGKLNLYTLPEGAFLPRVYAVSNFALLNTNGTEEIYGVVGLNGFNPAKKVLLYRETGPERGLHMPYFQVIKRLPVTNIGTADFSWENLPEGGLVARYRPGWQWVIRTDGEGGSDVLGFKTRNDCPYIFPKGVGYAWRARNSTLIFFRSGKQGMRIDSISEGGAPVTDIIGVWWETGWVGMRTKPITFPIVIPPHERGIIQINHPAQSLAIEELRPEGRNALKKWLEGSGTHRDLHSAPNVVFRRVNPTKYIAKISLQNADPFVLVLGERYTPGWKLYIRKEDLRDNANTVQESPTVKECIYPESFMLSDVKYIFCKAYPKEYHVVANGYANAWYLDPAKVNRNKGNVMYVEIYYSPQSWYYLGILISCSSLAFVGLGAGARFVRKGLGNRGALSK